MALNPSTLASFCFSLCDENNVAPVGLQPLCGHESFGRHHLFVSCTDPPLFHCATLLLLLSPSTLPPLSGPPSLPPHRIGPLEREDLSVVCACVWDPLAVVLSVSVTPYGSHSSPHWDDWSERLTDKPWLPVTLHIYIIIHIYIIHTISVWLMLCLEALGCRMWLLLWQSATYYCCIVAWWENTLKIHIFILTHSTFWAKRNFNATFSSKWLLILLVWIYWCNKKI